MPVKGSRKDKRGYSHKRVIFICDTEEADSLPTALCPGEELMRRTAAKLSCLS